MSTDLPPVTHDAVRRRFSIELDGLEGEATYRLQPGVMVIHHTAVDPRLQGRGVAAALVKAALDHARAEGLKVRPLCSYVDAYMRRHREVQDLRG